MFFLSVERKRIRKSSFGKHLSKDCFLQKLTIDAKINN